MRSLNNEMNQYLASEHGVDCSKRRVYAAWLEEHRPFHWFVEFHDVMTAGGFDVVVGNPPYVQVPQTLSRSLLGGMFKSALPRWSRDEDVYTLIVERGLQLLRIDHGAFGMILPLSLAASTKKPFVALRKVCSSERGLWLWSHFDRIPCALFGNDVRTRNTIGILFRSISVEKVTHATTPLLRWTAEERQGLFSGLQYSVCGMDISTGIPKVASRRQAEVLSELTKCGRPLGMTLGKSIAFSKLAAVAPDFPQPCVYVGGSAYNWFPAWRDVPETTNEHGSASLPARTAAFRFQAENDANAVFAILCSSLGYWWWAVASDGFNLKKWLVERCPLSLELVPKAARPGLAKLGGVLRRKLKMNYVVKENKGRIGNFRLPACANEVKAIDDYLATVVPQLSTEFFEDIRLSNSRFSRAANDVTADNADLDQEDDDAVEAGLKREPHKAKQDVRRKPRHARGA